MTSFFEGAEKAAPQSEEENSVKSAKSLFENAFRGLKGARKQAYYSR